MAFHRLVLVLVTVTSFTMSAVAADITDPAVVFPPETLAFASVNDPAAVAPQLVSLFRGTPLENGLKFIDGRRDAAKTPNDLYGNDEVALLALIASPEMAAEFKRLGGIGIGLTGFTDQCDPEAALVVLTGESTAAGLAARAFLTTSMVRKVSEVEGVAVYQYRQPSFTYDPNDGQQKLANEKPPTEGPYEATFAYVPGLFVAGTSKAAIAPVITRFRGKAKGSLADSAAFKGARAANRDPGVFFFVDVPSFCAKYDDAREKTGGLIEPDAYAWFKMIADTRAVKHVGGLARLQDGDLSVRVAATFDPNQKSPLFDLLKGPGVSVQLMRHNPAPASIAIFLALPEENRSDAVIGFLDAIAKSGGELGRLPGEAVKELEKKYKMSIGDELIAKIRSVGVVMPIRQDLPNGASPRPMLILFTEGEDAAARWEEFFPKLVADLSGSGTLPQPVSETIGGVKVQSLAGSNLPWKAAIHYARKDGTFVVGLDRRLVAAAAVPGKAVISIPDGKPPVLLGTLAAGGLVRLLGGTGSPSGPVVAVSKAGPVTRPRRGSGVAPSNRSQQEQAAKAWEDLLEALEKLPPTTVIGRRTGQELQFEFRQPNLHGNVFSGVVGSAVGWLDTVLDRKASPNKYPYPGYRSFRGIR